MCDLCNTEIMMSGKVRPNVATFRCGHNFHLSCVLKYSKTRYSDNCPKCNPVQFNNVPNFGTDRQTSIETLVSARREHREIRSDVSYLAAVTNWFGKKSKALSTLVDYGTSLNTLQINGYLPEDFIENQVPWRTLSSRYTIDALLDFGFRWHHMVVMGFIPEDFKALSWQHMDDTLNLSATDMLRTSITIQQLADIKLSIQQIKQLGFTWKDLTDMGGTAKTFKLLTSNLNDLKTYFGPSDKDWEKAGFTTSGIVQNKWKTSEFTPVRSKRPIAQSGLDLDF
tara:strand:+ start:706 stop:1551 length:846 start_codon:yes stop_codon:yes gene_type:complete